MQLSQDSELGTMDDKGSGNNTGKSQRSNWFVFLRVEKDVEGLLQRASRNVLYRVCLLVVYALVSKYVNELLDDRIIRWTETTIMGKGFLGMFNFEDTTSDGTNKNRNELEKVEILLDLIRSKLEDCRFDQ